MAKSDDRKRKRDTDQASVAPVQEKVAEPAVSGQYTEVELAFARRLAHNSLKTRNKAVSKLQTWLSRRTAHTANDMLKLWKGLFYCMWMSDKPLVQEQLTRALSELVQCFPDHSGAMYFMGAFFATMEREWQGLDRLRLDKFYHLLIEFLKQGILRVKAADWDEGVTAQFVTMLSEGPLKAAGHQEALGIALHLSDHMVELMALCGAAKAPPERIMQLLQPFWDMMVHTDRSVLIKRVDEGVVDKLLHQGEDDDDEMNFDGPIPEEMEINWPSLAAILFKAASDRSTAQMNRERLYDIRSKILSVEAKKARAQEEIEEEERRAELALNEPAKRVILTELNAGEEEEAETAPKKKSLKKKKKKKKRASPDLEEPGVETTDANTDEAPTTAAEPHTNKPSEDAAPTATSAKKARKDKPKKAVEPVPAVVKSIKGSAKKTKKGKVNEVITTEKEEDFTAQAVEPVPAVVKSVKGSAKKTKKAKFNEADTTEKEVKPKAKKAKLEVHTFVTPPSTPTQPLFTPLKSALGTPQDFSVPRRSSRIASTTKGRRVSWGENQVRRFKKKLPPSSVSAEKKKGPSRV